MFDATTIPADDGGGGAFETQVSGGDGLDTIYTGATSDTVDPGLGADGRDECRS